MYIYYFQQISLFKKINKNLIHTQAWNSKQLDVPKGRIGSGQVNRIVDWVRLTRIFTFFFFFKENKMYLSFEKSYNKLFDVKYIILNSPLILSMSLVKQINTCSIILKLYKSQHY